jgi:hypothetical protein
VRCQCCRLITKFIAVVGINEHKSRKSDKEYKKARLWTVYKKVQS